MSKMIIAWAITVAAWAAFGFMAITMIMTA